MHEHLPEFGLINMNGRMYDPLVGRMLSPDSFVHDNAGLGGYNRYTYAFNNPLKYTDPDGELPFLAVMGITAAVFGVGNVAAQAIAGDISDPGDVSEAFFVGAISGALISTGIHLGLQVPILKTTIKGLAIVRAATTTLSFHRGLADGIFEDDWSTLRNAGEIFLGNFYSDDARSEFSQVLQLTSRFSWEVLQTEFGYNFSQMRNIIGVIDRVDLYRGVTFSQAYDVVNGWCCGLSLGNFVNTENNFPDPNQNLRDRGLFRHEYGHTFDSHIFGPLYLFGIGIPSAFFNANWTETRVNNHRDDYFRRQPF